MGKWFANGLDLSVGEWQRLALARAFLRRAPIIVLDEPTSALDTWAEADWFDRFRALAQGKTAVIILPIAGFVALPFLVVSVEGAFRATRGEYDEVAAALGASRGRTFLRVTVPMAMPGIAAGLVLGWARSLGEFGATITFAGNFPGVTQTMPLAVYAALQSDPEAALVLSLLMLLVSVAVLALLRDRWFGKAAL